MLNQTDINKNILLRHYQNVLALLLKHVNQYIPVAYKITCIRQQMGLYEYRTLVEESKYHNNSYIYLW
jgi:hypothetical protein